MLLKRLIFISVLLFSINLNAANLVSDDGSYKMKAYFSNDDMLGRDVELKGVITSLTARSYSFEKDLTKQVQDKTKATVRLYNSFGIKKGDILYIINSRNFVTAKIEVVSIFKTDSFGYMLIGHGILRLTSDGDRVVQETANSNSQYAYIYKTRGDYYRELGQNDKAIAEYNKAFEYDKSNPEAHTAMGYIYLQNKIFQYAYKEFSEAKKEIGRIYDNEERFLLLKGICEVRFNEVYYTNITNELRIKYIKEGILNAKEALEIYNNSEDINFFIGKFYLDNANENDVDAKNHLLKVINLNSNKTEAYIALSKLYERHNNKDKSKFYANEALKIDPANDEAKYMIHKLK